jgi:hypothetical protein
MGKHVDKYRNAETAARKYEEIPQYLNQGYGSKACEQPLPY